MSDWDVALYLKFEAQRTLPAQDLANRVRGRNVARAVDIGCGPGNSTAVLRDTFPDAEITGIDNSPGMIGKARAAYPALDFRLCDIADMDGGYDLLFSNACLQWVPDHRSLLPALMQKLNPGGALAVQVPINSDEPLYKIISEAASDPKWGLGNVYFERNEALNPAEYYDILSGCAADFELWETVYYHSMPSHQALLDWVRGTRLRPYLDALDAETAAAFERQILQRVQAVYPVRENGQIVLRFRRLFFTAMRNL